MIQKQTWKAGNMLYPLPAVLVTVRDKKGQDNVFTVAWAGTICTNPAMISISVKPERYSYHAIMESGEFAINLTNEKLVWATDYCGVVSGREIDKFAKCGLTKYQAEQIQVPLIAESPVNIECKVVEEKALGSHTMFLAKVECVHASEEYMDVNGRFDLAKSNPIVYSHGEYYSLGKKLGTFGYSIKKQ